MYIVELTTTRYCRGIDGVRSGIHPFVEYTHSWNIHADNQISPVTFFTSGIHTTNDCHFGGMCTKEKKKKYFIFAL